MGRTIRSKEEAVERKTMVRLRLKLVENIPLLESTQEVRDFAHKMLDSGILPGEADRDAAHIAFAVVHRNGSLVDVELPPHRERSPSDTAQAARGIGSVEFAGDLHAGGTDRRIS